MSLELVSGARKTVGAKQTLKAMKRNEDCDEQVGKPLIMCAQDMGIPLDRSYSMMELGMACRIKVKAAAVGLLK